jgi:hypothetical protein
MTPPGLLLCTLGLKPCATSRDLTADGISQISSANPDRRFLLLEDFLRMAKCSFSELALQRLRLQLLLEPSWHKPPVLSFNDITKVLYLLSFSTLILSEGLARTPCGNHSTTSQVLNPSTLRTPAAAVFDLLCSDLQLRLLLQPAHSLHGFNNPLPLLGE